MITITTIPAPAARTAILLDGAEIGTLIEERGCHKRWHAVVNIHGALLQTGNVTQGFGDDAGEAVDDAIRAGLRDARRYIEELQILQAKLDRTRVDHINQPKEAI